MLTLPTGVTVDLDAHCRPTISGRLHEVLGSHAVVHGLELAVGDVVSIDGGRRAEVIASTPDAATIMPFGSLDGVRPGSPVEPTSARGVGVGRALLGRVLDGTGRPIDDGPPLRFEERVTLQFDAPDPLRRPLVDEALTSGVRAIDALLPLAKGQRTGIFAGSGVGKSSLLSMLVRGTDAPIRVLALIGERGREVREFIDRDLGPEGMANTVVLVATADQPAIVRRRTAFVATRIAEWFRDQGEDVLLLMDSVTRFCMAHREIGLAAGELPTSRGYPPTTAAMLSTLLERAGTSCTGSITGIYTVLVEGDDANEPVADTARSLLDGHIVLSRELAQAGHFPAIDVLASASRVAGAVSDDDELRLAAEVRRLLALEDENRDLVRIGAYVAGQDPELDRALRIGPALRGVLRQDLRGPATRTAAFAALESALRLEELRR